MLEFLTRQPVMQTAISNSQNPASGKVGDVAPTPSESGESFSKSLEQETRTAETGLKPAEDRNHKEIRSSLSESALGAEQTHADLSIISETAILDPVQSAASVADLTLARPQNGNETVRQSIDKGVVTELQDAAEAESSVQNGPAAQDILVPPAQGERAADAPGLVSEPTDVPDVRVPDTKAISSEAIIAQSVSSKNAGDSVDIEETEPLISQDGVSSVAATTEPQVGVQLAAAAQAASAPSSFSAGAALPTKRDATPTVGSAKTTTPVGDAIPPKTDTQNDQTVDAAATRYAPQGQLADAADANTGAKQDTNSADMSALKSTTASFEQNLAGQSSQQTVDPTAALGLNKALVADQITAKPLPEITLQVAQQKPELAVKQVGIELAKQAKNGDTHFIVRMDPPELGKLDVRLTINKAGEVQASILVDREATLDLLHRDARHLERSLTDAGLKMEQNALNLGLKNQDQNRDDLRQLPAGSQDGNENGTSDDGDGPADNIDGAVLAQMQISSGRPLDVVI